MIKELFVNACILVTMITISSNLFKESVYQKRISLNIKIIGGIIGGIIGILLMFFSMHISSKVILDFRHIAYVITSIYISPISTIIAIVMIYSFRVAYFGVSNVSLLVAAGGIVTGLGCMYIGKSKITQQAKWFYIYIYAGVVQSAAVLIISDNIKLLPEVLFHFFIASAAVSGVVYYLVKFLINNYTYIAQLRHESNEDHLTGLNNVRSFDIKFNQITNIVYEKNEMLSMLMIDIDHFKKVNDTYGHASGDMVLASLGRILKDKCRDFDVVSRMGGEEFSVLLRDCSENQALEIAERIRKEVEDFKFAIADGRSINVTISIGIATYPGIAETIEEIKEEADKALYEAKRTGRNRVC